MWSFYGEFWELEKFWLPTFNQNEIGLFIFRMSQVIMEQAMASTWKRSCIVSQTCG